MRWLKHGELSPLGALLSVLSAVSCGEVKVSSVVYGTVNLPCWFHFINDVDNLLVVWEKKETDEKNVQIFKSLNGHTDLSNQDSQFRGRTNLSGDISKGNLDLTLSGVTMSDDGVYFCRAANRINHGDNTVTLSVSPLPPQAMKSVAGGEVTLKLKKFGEPSEITWKLNTSKIVEKELQSPVPHFYRLDNKAVLNPDGSLTIRNLSGEDSGVYKSEVLVNNYIQEAEITLLVLDRISKPTITDNSSSLKIHLICRSSTVNVTYRWLDRTRGEIVCTGPVYAAPRPREDVELVCIVNNSISEESGSITILQFSGIKLSARHRAFTICLITLSLVLAIITVVFLYHKEFWKIKRYKSFHRMCWLCTDHRKRSTDYGDKGSQKTEKDKADTTDSIHSNIIYLDVQQTTKGTHEPEFWKIKRYKSVLRVCWLCTDHRKRSKEYGDKGTQKTEKDKRDTTYPIPCVIISSDKQQTTEGVNEPGFEKEEEDRRDATDNKHLLIPCDVHRFRLNSDSDYFSEEATEEAHLSNPESRSVPDSHGLKTKFELNLLPI